MTIPALESPSPIPRSPSSTTSPAAFPSQRSDSRPALETPATLAPPPMSCLSPAQSRWKPRVSHSDAKCPFGDSNRPIVGKLPHARQWIRTAGHCVISYMHSLTVVLLRVCRAPETGRRNPLFVWSGTPRMLRSTAASATVCASPRTFLQSSSGRPPLTTWKRRRFSANLSKPKSTPIKTCRKVPTHRYTHLRFPLPWRQLVRRHEQRLYVGGDVSQAPQCGGQFRTEHAEFIQHFLCACIVS